MKLKSFLPLFFSVFVAHYAQAQLEPQFTQYMYNRYLINPAFAGSDDALNFSLLHRSQYVSLSNRAIASQAFNFNMPIAAIRSGVGLTVINDLIGFQRATYIALNYDYRHAFKWGKMGIGIGAGIIQTSLDGAKLRTPEGDYSGNVNHKDNILPDNLSQGIAPDLSFGVYFNSNKFYAGAALNHIAISKAKINGVTVASSLFFTQNLLISGGYDFKINNRFSIMPSTLIKTDFVKVQAELSATMTIYRNILTGITFRGYNQKSIDALALFLGFKIKGVQLLYSYDANLSYLTRFNTGSHEVSLSYRYPLISKEKKGYFYHNPRFN